MGKVSAGIDTAAQVGSAIPYVGAVLGVAKTGLQIAQQIDEQKEDELSPVANAAPPLTVSGLHSTTVVKVAHLLDRIPEAWEVVGKTGAGDVYDSQPPDNRFLYLACSADPASPVTAKIRVS